MTMNPDKVYIPSESIYDDTDKMRELRAKLQMDYEAELAELAEDDVDTREKLEADVRSSLGFTVTDVFDWLDRQAAITEREYGDYQQQRIAELLEQRDEAQAAMIRARDERDELRKRLAMAEAESTRTDDGWMRLPVDADGQVIRIGDTITDGVLRKAEVIGVNERDVFFHDDGRVKCNRAKSWRRYVEPEPRTIEDATREFVKHVITFKGSRDGVPIVGIDDSHWRDYYSKYAAELRQMMGGDA